MNTYSIVQIVGVDVTKLTEYIILIKLLTCGAQLPLFELCKRNSYWLVAARNSIKLYLITVKL